MSIPLATTTITVKGRRPQADVDPEAEGYDAPLAEPPVVATGVRASITLPRGTRPAEADEVDAYVLRCDVFEAGLDRYSTVVDDSTGQEYVVVWVAPSLPQAFGLEHLKARIQVSKGISAGNESGGFIND